MQPGNPEAPQPDLRPQIVSVLTWASGDGIWTAAVEDHPEVMCVGETESQAMDRVLDLYGRLRPLSETGILGH